MKYRHRYEPWHDERKHMHVLYSDISHLLSKDPPWGTSVLSRVHRTSPNKQTPQQTPFRVFQKPHPTRLGPNDFHRSPSPRPQRGLHWKISPRTVLHLRIHELTQYPKEWSNLMQVLATWLDRPLHRRECWALSTEQRRFVLSIDASKQHAMGNDTKWPFYPWLFYPISWIERRCWM